MFIVEKGNAKMISIEFQDSSGNWRQGSLTTNFPQQILAAMKSLQWTYPSSRIRAVDTTSGRVVDIL